MRWILERNRPARSVSALLLIAVFLFLSAVASSPSLHKRLHPDAGTPGHHCAVSLFAGEQFDSAPIGQATVTPAALFAGIALLPDASIVPSADYFFSSSRAPPSRFV
jgi:hypothetical protein